MGKKLSRPRKEKVGEITRRHTINPLKDGEQDVEPFWNTQNYLKRHKTDLHVLTVFAFLFLVTITTLAIAYLTFKLVDVRPGYDVERCQIICSTVHEANDPKKCNGTQELYSLIDMKEDGFTDIKPLNDIDECYSKCLARRKIYAFVRECLDGDSALALTHFLNKIKPTDRTSFMKNMNQKAFISSIAYLVFPGICFMGFLWLYRCLSDDFKPLLFIWLMVLFSLFSLFFISILFGYILVSNVFDTSLLNRPIFESGNIFLLIVIASSFLLFLLCLLTVVLDWKKFPLIVDIVKIVKKPMNKMKIIILLAFLSIILTTAMILVLFWSVIFMESIGDLKIQNGLYYYEKDLKIWLIEGIIIFTEWWILFFMIDFIAMTIAAAIINWFFSTTDQFKKPGKVVLKGASLVLKCHKGTVAFGSFLQATFGVLFAIVDVFIHIVSDLRQMVAHSENTTCDRCSTAFGFGPHVITIIHGVQFCSAINECVETFKNVSDLKWVLYTSRFFFMLFHLFLSSFCMLVAALFIHKRKKEALSDSYPSLIFAAIAAYVIPYSMISIFRVTLMTICICHAQASIVNQDKYHLPELNELLNKIRSYKGKNEAKTWKFWN